jgi:predicted Zn-dependent protease
MKRSTIFISTAIVIALITYYAISPWLTVQSLQEIFKEKYTEQLKQSVDTAVLQYNLRKRIRERLYDDLLAEQGKKLKNIDESVLETRAAIFAEAIVQRQVVSADVVYLMLDPLIQDTTLARRIPLEQAYEMMHIGIQQAESRREGSSKYVIKVPISFPNERSKEIELWMIRYGMIWKITDIRDLSVTQ